MLHYVTNPSFMQLFTKLTIFAAGAAQMTSFDALRALQHSYLTFLLRRAPVLGECIIFSEAHLNLSSIPRVHFL
jgi:hypothetical protein